MKKKISTIGKNTIDIAQNEYRDNHSLYSDFDSFIKNCPTLNILISNNTLLHKLIEKNFSQKIALQPSIIGEVIAIHELAIMFKMNDLDINFDKNDGNYRAKFYNNKHQLLYYGDPKHHDAKLIINNKYSLSIEIKSYISRAGGVDLMPYNINGETAPRENTAFDTDEGMAIIEEFNKWNYGWKNMGTNFKFDKYNDVCKNISKNYFKNIKYAIIIYPTYIMLYEVNDHFYSLINYNNSEIRTTGKNSRKLSTLQHKVDEWQQENKIIKINNIYQVPINKLIPIRGRGKNEITRYGILNHYVFISAKDCTIKNEIIYFSNNNIKQCTPNGSVHITFMEDK